MSKQDREFYGQVVRCLPDLDSGRKQHFIDNPGELRQALRKALASPGKAFHLTEVNFHRSVEELVQAGAYDYADPSITPENFPAQRFGIEDVHCYAPSTEDLFGDPRRASSEEVIRVMQKKGLVPAGQIYGIHPLLTLGVNYADEQREAPIVDLGSVWRDSNGLRLVPILWGGVGRRGLDLSWFGDRWRSGRRFLAVRA